jgi:hypothetical protein
MSRTPKSRWRRRGPALFAAVALLGGSLYGLGPGSAGASSHREAPLIAADPTVDNTDFYAFVSPDRPDYVTFVANWIPFEEPNGGPNFYPFATDATYNIHVDNDGDAKPDASFRWTFKTEDRRGTNTFLYNNGPVTSLDDENLLVRQTYKLESSFDGAPFKTRVRNAPVAPSRVGNASMPDYGKLRDQASVTLPGGWKLFAGQADDPFFLDLRVFDLLYGGDLSEVGQDTVAGYNVNTIVLQVPFKDVALGGDAKRNPVIGAWTTTDRPRVRVTNGDSYGDRVQVSRLGNPLVNEVVVPAALKDAFNASAPSQDAKNPTLVKRVTNPEVPKLIEAIYGVPAPATPRNDLVEIFLTGITTKAGGPIKADLNSQLNNKDVNPNRFVPSEQLRLNLSVPVTAQPNRLGVLGGDLQGFPNGRRLADDVLDIEVQALAGAAQTGKLVDALATVDSVDANDQEFSDTFPYLALPNTAAVNGGAGGGSGTGSGGTGGAAAPADDDPALSPAGAISEMADVSPTVAMSAVGIATVGALAALFLLGWRRRWYRRGALVAATPSVTPYAAPVGPPPGPVAGSWPPPDDEPTMRLR